MTQIPNTWPVVEGRYLTEEDISREIIYLNPNGDQENGRLSSFREDGSVFVRFLGPTGERCPAASLRWPIALSEIP